MKLSDNGYLQVLVVQEKHYVPALVGFWKIPTGFILEVGFESGKLPYFLLFLMLKISEERRFFYSCFSVHFVRKKRSTQEL